MPKSQDSEMGFDPPLPDQSKPESFLTEIGKTIGQTNLYSLNHSLVKESILNSFNHLVRLLSEQNEIIIAWAERKILFNGTPLTALNVLAGTIGELFEKYQLHSLTFKRGVTLEELVSFYKLMTLHRKVMENSESVKDFLKGENVHHIEVNIAFFAQVTGEEVKGLEAVGQGKGGTVLTNPFQEKKDKKELGFVQKLKDISLEEMIWEVIQRAIEDSEDQKKVYEIIFKQIQSELDNQVERATRKLREEKEQITNEQERIESVINNISQGVVIVDESGKIIMMNSIAEEIYGSSLTKLKGEKITDISKEGLLIALSKDIANLLGQDFSKEVIVQSTENTREVITNSTVTIRNPDGKIVGITSILNDIAKQRELQRMQDDFVVHVTHELRSPLTAIKAAIGTLFDETLNPANHQQKQVLYIANQNIDRLTRLINDLLDFGKAEAGKLQLNLHPTDAISLLQETVQSLQSWASSKGISIIPVLPQEIPKVMIDRDRIIQVVVNLVSNAIKFTPPNGKIVVQTHPVRSLYLKVSISDTGPGISKKEQERIFKKFYQLQQTERSNTPGTGLGLFIAKTIIELHKGEIEFESEEGKGTTFYFTLPIFYEPSPIVTVTKKRRSWFRRFFGLD